MSYHKQHEVYKRNRFYLNERFVDYRSENAPIVSSLRNASSIANSSLSSQVLYNEENVVLHREIQRTNREPNDNANRTTRRRSLVPIPIDVEKKFEGIFDLQGPFKHDSAKTKAARTSTCLSENRLSDDAVSRF